eukprot:Rhum_TRINITY_DN11905_c0_g1::Rhum_TRINITY_DN11905_c0_g1_i1::g.47801::m.47801
MVPSAPDLDKNLLGSGSPLLASTSMSQNTIDYMRQMAGYDAVGSPFRRASFVACAMASGYSPDVDEQARAEMRPRSASSPSLSAQREPQLPPGRPKAGAAPVRRQLQRPPSPCSQQSPLLTPKLFVTPDGQPCDLLNVSPRAGSVLLSANKSLLGFSPTRSPQQLPDCAPQQQPEKPQPQPEKPQPQAQPQPCPLQAFVLGKEGLHVSILELLGSVNESACLFAPHLSCLAQLSLSRAQPLACSTAVADMLHKVPPESPVRGVIDAAVFGVEIEAFLPKFPDEADDNTCDKANAYICPFLNRVLASTGIVFKYHMLQNARVDHSYECWKVTTDGSIAALTKADGGKNGIFGFEVVSAKLRGWRGLGEVACVAKALTQMNARTNASTGLHVHVSCKAYTDKQLQNLGAFLLYYERVTDTFHPHARRGDNSTYARSLSYSVSMCAMRLERMGAEGPSQPAPPPSLPPSTVKATQATPTPGETHNSGGTDADETTADVVRQLLAVDVGFPAGFSRLLSMLNPRTGVRVASGRYHKANFTNLRATSVGDEGRRVEYRQHEGTCDVNAIVMWVRFLSLFTQNAATSTATPDLSVPATFDSLFDHLVPDAEVQAFYRQRVAEHGDAEPDATYPLRTYCM